MKWVKACILSALITIGVSLLLLAVIAFFVCRSGSLPRNSLVLITTLAGCAAVFLGGFLSSLSVREKGLLLGLSGGVLLIACAALVSVCLYGVIPEPASAGKAAAVLLSGAIGGILGANRKQKVKF